MSSRDDRLTNILVALIGLAGVLGGAYIASGGNPSNLFKSIVDFFHKNDNVILTNGSFESGGTGWAGSALNYFSHKCKNKTSINPKHGKCYALFDNAYGTSLFQHDKNKRSGNYEASVEVAGRGKVRFGIQTYCNGTHVASDGFKDDVILNNDNSWTTLKAKTSRRVEDCELKWEMYIDTDKPLRVDRASIYETF